MKEARIELKIKNNILYKEIMKRASSVSQFCIKYGYWPSDVGDLLCLRASPWSSRKCDEGWRKTPKRLAELFKMLIEDLFPAGLYIMEKAEAVMEVSVEMLSLQHHSALMIESPEDQYLREEAKDEIRNMVSSLNPREYEIVCDLHGIGRERLTLGEIGKRHNVTRERVRQIGLRAERRLRRRMEIAGGEERFRG